MSPLELNGVKKLSRDLVINSNKTLMKVQKDYYSYVILHVTKTKRSFSFQELKHEVDRCKTLMFLHIHKGHRGRGSLTSTSFFE